MIAGRWCRLGGGAWWGDQGGKVVLVLKGFRKRMRRRRMRFLLRAEQNGFCLFSFLLLFFRPSF